MAGYTSTSSEPKHVFEFAVKRAHVLTTFEHVDSAYRYWRACMGGVMLSRDGKGPWVPVCR